MLLRISSQQVGDSALPAQDQQTPDDHVERWNTPPGSEASDDVQCSHRLTPSDAGQEHPLAYVLVSKHCAFSHSSSCPACSPSHRSSTPLRGVTKHEEGRLHLRVLHVRHWFGASLGRISGHAVAQVADFVIPRMFAQRIIRALRATPAIRADLPFFCTSCHYAR